MIKTFLTQFYHIKSMLVKGKRIGHILLYDTCHGPNLIYEWVTFPGIFGLLSKDIPENATDVKKCHFFPSTV